jgi:hypothetical protein
MGRSVWWTKAPPRQAGFFLVQNRVVGTRFWIVALVALALAWGAVLVKPGPNQNAHLARVTALAHGTTRIDPYHNWSADIAYYKGHYYAAKAPGLALLTVPWYFVLEATGLLVHGPPPNVPWPLAESFKSMSAVAPWELALWGSLLPFLGLLLLVRTVTEKLVPGCGTVTAVTLGAGSLVAIFSTIFFDHELSAFLGFAAFALLFRERSAGQNRRLLLAAGLTAGLATTVEFPLVLVAGLLGLYALARPGDRLRRLIAYGGGLVVGVLPLFAYNLWEGGTLRSISYAYAVRYPGASGHDVMGANASGFFGVGVPSLGALAKLLVSPKGLFVLTPVWAIALTGLVVLWRNGRRAESALAGSVCAAFLIYNAGYYLPLGGFNGGPRFLVPMLPFLALGLAAAWQAWPGPTLALAGVSVAFMTVAILSDPMLVSEDGGVMFHRLERGGDRNGPLPLTVFHWFWHDRRASLLVIGAVVLAVVAVVYAPIARRLTRRQFVLGLVALGAWRILYAGGTVIERAPHGWPVALALLLAVAATTTLLVRGERWAFAPALLLVPAGWPRFTAHTSLALLLVSGVLVALAAVAVRSRRAASPAAP